MCFFVDKLQNFTITLKAARVNQNLTQQQVADMIGVSKHTIINWEKGKVKPSYAAIFTLSHIYDININNFHVK